MAERIVEFVLCTLAIAVGLRLYDWARGALSRGRQ